MSSGRSGQSGEKPEEIFILSNETYHRVYSKLADAKRVKTNEARYDYRDWPEAKIFRGIITEWEEVD